MLNRSVNIATKIDTESFMELDDSLPYSQKPAIGPYPESVTSNPHFTSCFFKIPVSWIVFSFEREIWSLHGSEDPSQDLLDCNTV
jgi:hypothetical protein